MHLHARTSSTSALSAIDFAWAKLYDARERKRDERENAALYPRTRDEIRYCTTRISHGMPKV